MIAVGLTRRRGQPTRRPTRRSEPEAVGRTEPSPPQRQRRRMSLHAHLVQTQALTTRARPRKGCLNGRGNQNKVENIAGCRKRGARPLRLHLHTSTARHLSNSHPHHVSSRRPPTPHSRMHQQQRVAWTTTVMANETPKLLNPRCRTLGSAQRLADDCFQVCEGRSA